VPLPGDVLFVAHLSGSLLQTSGVGSSLEVADSWGQDDSAACHHMKTVCPIEHRPVVLSFKYTDENILQNKN
jgi:hypothetical protein